MFEVKGNVVRSTGASVAVLDAGSPGHDVTLTASSANIGVAFRVADEANSTSPTPRPAGSSWPGSRAVASSVKTWATSSGANSRPLTVSVSGTTITVTSATQVVGTETDTNLAVAPFAGASRSGIWSSTIYGFTADNLTVTGK